MQASREVREIIAGWFEAVANGDPSWLARHLSSRVRLVGTDPEEWLSGADALNLLTEEAKALGGQVKIDPGMPEAFAEGSVAWGVTQATITLPGGKQIHPRWAAVFHQEDGQWKAVQIHASVGVPNADLLA
jgi:ketosteroid isomerase-like protein